MKKIARKKFSPEKTDLLLNEIYPGQNLNVPDPWYGEEPGYHEVFEMIDQACEKIIEKYGFLKNPPDMSKPGLPQGTRNFGPETVYKRNFIFETIRSVFELYGYEPLETPAMENLDTLIGKIWRRRG